MKTVSEAYKTSMASLLRNRSYVRITFGNVDTTAATDGEWESNGALYYSEFDTLDYDFSYGQTYATLELNRWSLDGSSLILPDSGIVQDGFISSHMSDAEGKYDTPAVLTRAFTQIHTLPGLTLTFDTRQEEWPPEVTVDFYLSDTVVDTQTVQVTGTQVIVNTTETEVDKVTITFGSCLPYRRPRLESVLYGVDIQFTNDDLVSTEQKHDVDPLSRRLPSETMEFTILDFDRKYDPDNPGGIYAFVDENSPIEIQFGYELPDGTIEWLKADRYVLDGKPTAQNNQATFSGTGLIGSLTDTFYKSKLGSKNLYDMAEEVLLDAQLTPTEQGENPWVIDESLKNMFTTAALPIDTHMNCLQLIAHAACCRLYTDDDNIIHIEPFSLDGYTRDTDFTLDFSSIAEDSQTVSKIDKLKSVSVSRYSYSVDDSSSTLLEETTTETEFYVEFSGLAQDVQISVSGGTLISSEIYARAADLVLSSGTKTVTITGKTLSENSVVVSYPVSQSGEVDEEENPLITNDEMCLALANHVISYLQMRNTYEASYRGNPELEVGDIIGLQTLYTDEMDALILVDEISFDGSLSGNLTVKGLI